MTSTLFNRVFLVEARLKHQPKEEPLTHAVYDLHSVRSKGRSADKELLSNAERNRKHQERRIEMMSRREGKDVTGTYPRQNYQDHNEHAHQVARIQVARHANIDAHRSDNAVHFAGKEKHRAKHAHTFAGSMNRLHGEGSASVSDHNHPEHGPVHKVALSLPSHSDEERRGHAEHHDRLLDDAHTRIVKTGGEHIAMRSKPRTLAEKMFMRSVTSGESKSRSINDKTTGEPIVFGEHPDPKYKSWKGYHKHMSGMKSGAGKRVVVHFWRHPKTGHRTGFKFKPQAGGSA